MRTLDLLATRLTDNGLTTELNDGVIELRPDNSEVGTVVIRQEEFRFTVAIGEHFHRHFEHGANADTAIEEIVRLVVAFATDNAVLTIFIRNSQPIRAEFRNVNTGEVSTAEFPVQPSSLWSRITAPFRKTHSYAYRWSGRVRTQQEIEAQLKDQILRLTLNEAQALKNHLTQVASLPGTDASSDQRPPDRHES